MLCEGRNFTGVADECDPLHPLDKVDGDQGQREADHPCLVNDDLHALHKTVDSMGSMGH